MANLSFGSKLEQSQYIHHATVIIFMKQHKKINKIKILNKVGHFKFIINNKIDSSNILQQKQTLI